MNTPKRSDRGVAPRISGGALGFRRLIHQSLERSGLVDRQIGEDLAVDHDPGAGEPGDKSAVGQAMLAHGGVDALDPERAEVTLALLAADIVVLQRLVGCGIGRGDVVLAAAPHALGLLEDLLAAGVAGYGTWCAAHGLDPSAIRHPALHAPEFGYKQRDHAAQVAGTSRRIVDQPVALADLVGLDLAFGGDFEALFSARLGLHLGHFAILHGTRTCPVPLG